MSLLWQRTQCPWSPSKHLPLTAASTSTLGSGEGQGREETTRDHKDLLA